jgi:predicted RNase H-like nuclease (RuvC/YqgF family)
VKKFKHQIGNLEKQLDVSRGECEDLATQCSALREKLIKKRKKMQDIISKEGNNIDLRISVSKLDLKIPMKLSIGLRN